MGIFKKLDMRTFAAAAFTALVSADKSDFPNDAWNHAGCHMTVTFTTDCTVLYTSMDTEIRSWNPEPLDTPGYYSIHEEGDDYIWSDRLTYNQKYNDEQLFEFATSGSGCQVTAKSRSDTPTTRSTTMSSSSNLLPVEVAARLLPNLDL